MLPEWGDNPSVAHSKFSNVKETLIKPAMTAPLESLTAFADAKGNLPPGLKALGAENVIRNLKTRHKQVFGEDWSGSSPTLISPVWQDVLAPGGQQMPAFDPAAALNAHRAHKGKP